MKLIPLCFCQAAVVDVACFRRMQARSPKSPGFWGSDHKTQILPSFISVPKARLRFNSYGIFGEFVKDV